MNTSIERYGYKCQKCKHYWVLLFDVQETGKEFWQYGKWNKVYRSTLLNPPAEYLKICPDMSADGLLSQSPRYWKLCPKCKSSWVKVRLIVGHVNPKVPCNRDCTHAQGDKCVCSCGGVNHGMAYVVTIREIATQ